MGEGGGGGPGCVHLPHTVADSDQIKGSAVVVV